MSYGVTATGFVRPTLAEILTRLNTAASTIWPGIDLEADGKWGQLAGLWSKEMADAWDCAQEIYTSRNVNEATGASLDNILAELGMQRIDAAPTTIYHALLWGTSGTVIAAGKKARQSSSLLDCTLESAVTISSSMPMAAKLELADPSGSTTYSVVLNAVTVATTATSKDAAGNSLASIINFSSFPGSASYSSGILAITGVTDIATSATFSLGTLVNMTISAVANAGTFHCDTEGPYPFPAGTLDTIMNPVTGWDSISNPLAGVTGRNSETDSEFRARSFSFYATGKATQEAIRQAILNQVTGIVSCSVTSNRTDVADADGRPAHSFEVLVEGGTNADIAAVIWDTCPAGIAIHGSITEAVADSEGHTQYVKFSRPSYAYIWVKVQRAFNPEEVYPTDGDAQIKANIVAWALSTYRSGKNVYRRDIMTPINAVPGLGDVIVLLGNTTDGSVPSSYSAVDLAMGATVLPQFDVSRITVEAHP